MPFKVGNPFGYVGPSERNKSTQVRDRMVEIKKSKGVGRESSLAVVNGLKCCIIIIIIDINTR